MGLDIERLRYDLIDYYGTAANNGFPMAIIELSKIEMATENEIIRIAQNNNIDLNDYLINNNKKYR